MEVHWLFRMPSGRTYRNAYKFSGYIQAAVDTCSWSVNG